MAEELNRIASELLRGLGRMGSKAIAKAVDSALEDVQGAANELDKRLARARKRIEEMTQPKDPKMTAPKAPPLPLYQRTLGRVPRDELERE